MDKIKVSEIRAQFPMYDDMPDEQLLSGVRKKFYPDMPMGDFLQRIDFDTERARQQKAVTDGMTTTQKVLAGTGKAFMDVGRGVGQLVGLVSNEDVQRSRELDAPLMNTTSGKVGNVLGNVAIAAPTALIPGANTVAGAGLVGAGMGFIQPATSIGERGLNTAIGGFGGAAGQKVANKVGQIARNSVSELSQGQQAAAASGKKLGMRLTPGKASGSPMLQRFEAALESNPMTSSGFDAIKDTNQKALNRAAAKAIGENADELSTPVLARANDRIVAVLDSVKDKTPVPLDPVQVGGRLQQIAAKYEGQLMGNAEVASNALWQRLDDFVNNRGGATREQLRALSSNLGNAAKNNMTQPSGDRALGKALFEAQELIEDAIQGTLSKSQRAAYAEARGQYRNLMNLTTRTNITNPSSGDVSGRGLASELMRKDRGGFTMGRNDTDMYNAARFYQAFPNIVGDSGTATRSMGAADYIAGLPTNLLARMYLSQPVTRAAELGGGAASLGARALDNRLLQLLAQPAGTASALQLSNALQQ